jgi:adenosylcobinamide-GDP ribazoletransferase
MRAAFALLTIFGGARRPEPAAARWFPVVGVVVGAAVGGVWWGAAEVWPLAVAAVLAVVADVVVTGALHLDGVADSADGLLPHLARDRRLDVMASPDIGAFGVTGVALALLLRVAAFASMSPEPLIVAAIWCASRTTMAVVMSTVDYVRPGGLAEGYRGVPPGSVAVLGAGVSMTLAAVAEGAPGAVAVVGCAVTAAIVVAFARSRVGGYTGDVLGAAGVVGETAGLLVACARW